MSDLTMGRGKVLGATAAVAVVLATLSSGGAAQAAPLDLSQLGFAHKATSGSPVAVEAAALPPSACTVTSYAPNKIVLGATRVKKTFSVKVADCTLDKWLVALEPFFTINEDTLAMTGVAGNLSDEEGSLTPRISLSPRVLKNSQAGKKAHRAAVAAWGVGEDVDAVEPASGDLSLTLLRRATFGSSFDAAPGSVAKGKKITLTGKLVRINWNGAKKLKYIGFAGKAQVQFKADGESEFVTVKTVKASSKGKVSTTVKAKKTGTWRLFFAGLSTTAPATSGSDAVKVN
ncbi:MAG TPA: hypothetical protein VLL08_32875 [Kineosporiaceae bacterium]|nr:hypothetical protein [Kineosporiaceae bacterium]